MIKKRKFFKKKQEKIIIKFKNINLFYKIKKSLIKNQFIHYIKRISMLIFNKFYFKSIQKLICLKDLSLKIPDKSINMSRFSLNKNIDNLKFFGIFKNVFKIQLLIP